MVNILLRGLSKHYHLLSHVDNSLINLEPHVLTSAEGKLPCTTCRFFKGVD
jgi:hypothetical protein